MKTIIDISHHNGGTFNWDKIKSTVDGVIIRCGYRGYGSGKITKDRRADEFANACVRAGIPIGFYFMSQAITNDEAREEALYTIEYAKKYKATLPLIIDSEDGDGTAKVVRADGLSKPARTSIAKVFCETINANGYTGGVYASESWFNSKLNYNELKNYFIWCANYGKKTAYKTSSVSLPRFDMHQYTSKAIVDGVPGNVDISELYTEKVLPNAETKPKRPTLKFGSKGQDVVDLQTILNRKGFNCGKADGIFGRKTEAAVISFQGMNVDENGKPLVKDGIVGKKTWAKLL